MGELIRLIKLIGLNELIQFIGSNKLDYIIPLRFGFSFKRNCFGADLIHIHIFENISLPYGVIKGNLLSHVIKRSASTSPRASSNAPSPFCFTSVSVIVVIALQLL